MMAVNDSICIIPRLEMVKEELVYSSAPNSNSGTANEIFDLSGDLPYALLIRRSEARV